MRLPILFLVVVLATTVVSVDTEWWKTALIYQIYPRSFKDSNGDGIGDLNGITDKLPYIKDTGFDAIWLSPIFLSPMYDFGYDITDYRQIAPEYGTMDDFKKLLVVSHDLGIRVVLDYVPNHTSNESAWFVKSVRREAGYEDYYIWADGIKVPGSNETKPPSNWVSTFRKSAWEYNAVRGQYYLHQFVIGQPDLNYRSTKVQQEMKDVLKFWLDLGVSGFRVDAINRLYEANPEDFGGRYPDEPLSGNLHQMKANEREIHVGTVLHLKSFPGTPGAGPDDYEYLKHIYTEDLNETYSVVYDWRDVLDEYISKHGEYKIMMTEAYTDLSLMIRYYGTETRNGSIPFNFSFLGDITKDSDTQQIKTVIDKWMTYMPSGKTANWVNGNHDQSRMPNRQGVDRVDAMNMLALLLPGVAITYQGEEIGMTDGEVSWEETRDPQACNTDDPVNYWKKSRDPNRTPYHWDNSTNAGFSTGKTWLPVAKNYPDVNLVKQMEDKISHYHFYKDVASLRKIAAVKYGDLNTVALSDSTLAITRLLPRVQGVVGVINLSNEDQLVNLSSLRLLPGILRVVAVGVNCNAKKGSYVLKNQIPVSAHCALVLQTLRWCC